MSSDDELVWGDQPEAPEEPAQAPKHEDIIAQLEKELHAARKELAAKV